MAKPSYSFVKIADNTGLFDTFPHGPSINDHGNVLFTARYDGGGAGYFLGPDPLLDRAVTGSGYNGVGSHRAQINNAGTIVFDGHRNTIGNGVFTVSPEATRAENSGAYDIFLNPVINNVGDVAFFAFLDWVLPAPQPEYGIFRGPNPATDVVGTGTGTSAGTYLSFDDPDINDAGTVVFRSTLTAGGSGVFTGPNPATDTLIDTTGPYALINGKVSINNVGVVAFRADLDGGGSGIFIGPDPALHAVATDAGPYSILRDADINSDGTIVFEASLDAGGEGIFTGADPVANRIIATGDPLFDSTLATVTFLKGLNDRGDIAFVYALANGERGVAVASVPEPASAVVLALGSAVLLSRRRRRR